MDEGAILSSKFIIINVQEMVELHNDTVGTMVHATVVTTVHHQMDVHCT